MIATKPAPRRKALRRRSVSVEAGAHLRYLCDTILASTVSTELKKGWQDTCQICLLDLLELHPRFVGTHYMEIVWDAFRGRKRFGRSPKQATYVNLAL